LARPQNSNVLVTFYLFRHRNFRIPAVSNLLERNKVMNWKKFVLFGCAIACVFAVSPATAQMRGHGTSMGRMPMHRAPMQGSMGRMPMHRAPMLDSMGRMPMHRAPMQGSMGRMPMHRAPMMNSPSGLRRWGDGDFDRDDRFRHFNNFNEIIFITNLGLPWWWNWGWGPWGWGWNWGYPYGSDYLGYGNGY